MNGQLNSNVNIKKVSRRANNSVADSLPQRCRFILIFVSICVY
jgi:hypothetical protein